MNVFGEVWTAHKSLGSSCTSSRGQTLRFNTPRSMQGLKVELDEHKKTTTMFQDAMEYNVQMTNILLRLSKSSIKILNKLYIELGFVLSSLFFGPHMLVFYWINCAYCLIIF
jgi:hypothetical protein